MPGFPTNAHPHHAETADETIHVLHVDDEQTLTEVTRTYLEQENDEFVVHSETDPTDALQRLAAEPIECLVSDYDMPGMDGLELLDRVREVHPDLPFILFTGRGSEAVASEAISAGVTDYIQKGGPETYELLAHRIEHTTDEYRSQQFTRRTNHQPTQLLERITDAFIAMDDDWRLTYVNQAAADAFETTPEQMLGTVLWEFVPEAVETRFYEAYHDAKESGQPTSFEAYYEPWDRWYREHIYPDENGLSVIFKDITAQRQNEKAVERVNERFQAYVENASDIITVLDEDGIIQYQSPAIERILGYGPDEIIGDNAFEYIHPDDRERVTAFFAEVVASSEPITMETEYRFRTADGSWVWLESIGSNKTDTAVDGYVVNSRDVTERKERERDLRHSRSQLRSMIDAVDEYALFRLAADGRIQQWTQGAETLTGHAAADVLGTDFTSLVSAAEDTLAPAALLDRARTEGTIEVDGWWQRADGSRFWATVTISPYRDDDDELAGFVTILRDVTERTEIRDPALELEFRSPALAASFQAHGVDDCSLTLDSRVRLDADTTRHYWTVSGADPKSVSAAIDALTAVTDVNMVRTVEDSARFEVTVHNRAIGPVISTLEGRLQSIEIDGGDCHVVAEFPDGTDSAAVEAALSDRDADIELVSERRVLTPTYLRRMVDDTLTDRQRTVLRMAYLGDYFAHPRRTTGEELAETLDITKQTFHHHLRKAQAGVFEHLFEDPPEPRL